MRNIVSLPQGRGKGRLNLTNVLQPGLLRIDDLLSGLFAAHSSQIVSAIFLILRRSSSTGDRRDAFLLHLRNRPDIIDGHLST
jgi:hypothetical protein